MRRLVTSALIALAFVLACVPWDELVDECLDSGRCTVAPDGAILPIDAGVIDSGAQQDAGGDAGVDAGIDAGIDAGSCPAPLDDLPAQGGCRHGGICAAVFVDGGPVRIFPVDKTSPCGFAQLPSVSVAGMRALFSWTDVDAGPPTAPQMRVRWAEVALDTPTVTAGIVPSQTGSQTSSSVAYRGDGGAIAWTEQGVAGRFNDAYVSALSSGSLGAPTPVFERDENQTQLSLTASDGGYLLLFREEQMDAGPANQEGIRAVRLSLNAQPLTAGPGAVVAMRTRPQTSPLGCFDGMDYRAVWLDDVSATNANDVFTAAIDPTTLAVMPSAGLGVSTDSGVQEEHPSIACASPSLCAVAYYTAGGIVRVSIISGGNVQGPPTRLSGGGEVTNSAIGIGYTGRDFLVVWSEDVSVASGTNIQYARVNVDGGVARGETMLLDVPGDQLRPAVSCSPQACAVVWEH